jgi:2-polyprenyl-3-methyl-5-hydroxy-6-metoxy-1,4-benzoquinol methylase
MYFTEQKCLQLMNDEINNPFENNELHTFIELIKYGKIDEQYINYNIFYKIFNSFCMHNKFSSQFSNDFLNFVNYTILYYTESQLFENYLVNILSNKKSILDLGCGACMFWLNNPILIHNSKKITCIDLNQQILKYPKYLLKQHSKISVDYADIYDFDIKDYDTVLFIEVIMQIPEPHKMLQHIWNTNPNCTVIFAHNVYNHNLTKIFTPFRIHLFPYLPVLNIAYGKALSYQATLEIIEKAQGQISQFIDVDNTRKIFVATSKKSKIHSIN